MTICVKEPGSGAKLQLEVKVPGSEYATEWAVMLPEGEAVLFYLIDGTWATHEQEKISDEFANAIGNVIGLLTAHEQAEKDLDKFFREPPLRFNKNH